MPIREATEKERQELLERGSLYYPDVVLHWGIGDYPTNFGQVLTGKDVYTLEFQPDEIIEGKLKSREQPMFRFNRTASTSEMSLGDSSPDLEGVIYFVGRKDGDSTYAVRCLRGFEGRLEETISNARDALVSRLNLSFYKNKNGNIVVALLGRNPFVFYTAR